MGVRIVARAQKGNAAVKMGPHAKQQAGESRDSKTGNP
jgi:hypothetical protein